MFYIFFQTVETIFGLKIRDPEAGTFSCKTMAAFKQYVERIKLLYRHLKTHTGELVTTKEMAMNHLARLTKTGGESDLAAHIAQPFHFVMEEFARKGKIIEDEFKREATEFKNITRESLLETMNAEESAVSVASDVIFAYNELVKGTSFEKTKIEVDEETKNKWMDLYTQDAKQKKLEDVDTLFTNIFAGQKLFEGFDVMKEKLVEQHIEPQTLEAISEEIKAEVLSEQFVKKLATLVKEKVGVTFKDDEVDEEGAIFTRKTLAEWKEESLKMDPEFFMHEYPVHLSQVGKEVNVDTPTKRNSKHLLAQIRKKYAAKNGENAKLSVKQEKKEFAVKLRSGISSFSDCSPVISEIPDTWRCIEMLNEDEECNMDLPSLSHLAQHAKEVHQTNIYPCILCCTVHSTEQSQTQCYVNHFPLDFKNHTSMCYICMTVDLYLQGFPSRGHLYDHMCAEKNHAKLLGGRKLAGCGICGKNFRTRVEATTCQRNCMFHGVKFACGQCEVDKDQPDKPLPEFDSYAEKVEHYYEKHPKEMQKCHLVNTSAKKFKDKPADPHAAAEIDSMKKKEKQLKRLTKGVCERPENEGKSFVKCPRCTSNRVLYKTGDENEYIARLKTHWVKAHSAENMIVHPEQYLTEEELLIYANAEIFAKDVTTTLQKP